MIYITIEETAGNAFIALLEHDPNVKRTISCHVIFLYCYEVQDILHEQGIETCNLFSDLTWRYLGLENKYFDFDYDDGDCHVDLRDDCTPDDLRKEFRDCLNLDVLKAFTSKRALAVLGINE